MTRDEAIKILTEIQTKRKKYIGQTECNNALNMAIEALQAEPVKHGKWQVTDKRLIGAELWVCSVCGSPLMTDDINENHYCPNCGAKMTGGEG